MVDMSRTVLCVCDSGQCEVLLLVALSLWYLSPPPL